MGQNNECGRGVKSVQALTRAPSMTRVRRVIARTPVTPIPPLVMPECPDDPTQGFTEYKDTFVIQRPYDLPAAARFKIEDGIYTFFVNSNDKAHEPGNTTAPCGSFATACRNFAVAGIEPVEPAAITGPS